jgi:uncharacterized protein
MWLDGQPGKAVLVKLKVDDIPKEGTRVFFEENQWRPEELGEVVAGFNGPVCVDIWLDKQEDGLIQANGEFSADLKLSCGRCLEDFDQKIQGRLNLVFLPQPMEADSDELELTDEDMEVSFYDGGEIDLSEALRDELALSLPMAPLCRPDCQGLCPVCGKPRAEGDCGCENDEQDPRWSKLAGLKMDKSE